MNDDFFVVALGLLRLAEIRYNAGKREAARRHLETLKTGLEQAIALLQLEPSTTK